MSETQHSDSSHNLIQRQAAANSELTSCTTFPEMAGAIARHMPLQDEQFISINRVTHDYANQVFRLQTLAWAYPEQPYEGSTSVEIPLPGTGYPLDVDTLDYNSPLVIAQVQGSDKLNSTYRNWLGAYKVISFANFPIRFGGRVIGTLGINSRSMPIQLSADEQTQYQLLANQLGALIEVHSLNLEVSFHEALIERQSRTFADLTANMDYEQMAAVVARHMLPTIGRFLGISQFIYDASGEISGWQVVASANRERVYNWTNTPVMSWAKAAPSLRQSVLDGKPFIMHSLRDVQPEDDSQELHPLLGSLQVESYISIPMLIDGRPVAAMLVMSRAPHAFTHDEINAFANLGDQMSTLIHSRTLLEEAHVTRKMALQLVQTNRNITLTNSLDDIGNELLQAMPPAVSGLTIALFNRPIQAHERAGSLETVVLANRDGIHPLTTIDRLNGEANGFAETLKALHNSQTVVLEHGSTQVALPSESLARLYAEGASSVTVIGLQAGTRLLGVLGLGSSEPLDKTAQQAANLRAMADQIGITLENRSLLKQTSDSLSLVQTQFETSNIIYRSTHPAEILEAIYRFAGQTYESGQIALVEPESDPPMLRIAAELRNGKTHITEHLVPMDAFPAHSTLRSLETLYIPDVSLDTYLSDAEREILRQQNIDSLLIVPMVVNANLVGLLVFSNRKLAQGVTVSMRSLRGMADLAAVVVENRSLLQITGQSLEETQLLYEINRAILGSQDTLDVLRVIRELLSPDASVISELQVNYDDTNMIQEMTINTLISAEGEQVIQMPLREQMGLEGLRKLQAYWENNPSNVSIVEDLAGADSDYPISDFVKMSGAHSFVNIIVRQNGLVTQMVAVSFAEPRKFTPTERRLYVALSDQITIVMQNHRLLRETQLAAEQMGRRVTQLQGINQVSSRILAETDETLIVKQASEALVRLLGIDHCGITLVDPDDPETLVVVGEYPAQGALNARLPLRNNPLWDALQKRNFQPLYVPSREDSLIEPATRSVLTQLGIYSLGLVPIISNNRIIGGVGLDITSPQKTITPEMLELAQILVVPLNIGLQNLRLLGDVRKSANQLGEQVDTLRSLQEIEARISTAQDEQTLLNQSVEDLAKLLQADHCGIALLDPSQKLGTVVSEYPNQGAIGVQFNLEGNPLYEFVNKKRFEPIIIDSVDTSPLLDERNRAFLQSVGTKSIIVLPLVVHDRAIGSIGIDMFTDNKTISPTMIDLAQTVSSQIAIALQNRRLVSEAERRASQLQRIATFSQGAQASLALGTTLENMLDEAGQMLPQNQISICLYDKSEQQLKVVAQRIDDGVRLTPNAGDTIPITGQMATVWTKAEPVYTPDLRAVTPDMDVGVTLRSWLLVPVMGHGSIVGIVSVGSDQAYAYTETDIRLFSQLVSQFGVVLENIEAYRQSQQIARNESLVNDISAQLQRQLDIQGMLNVTAAELGKAIGARRARIRLATNVPETDTETSAE